ncbi:MAG: hypothetical protein AAFQ41_14560 [Cyanobacteria bacterium J06623_7]
MLKAWLVGVGILFVLAEFSIWLKQFILPLPLYILGGAFLAIASNYERGIIGLFRQEEANTDALTQTATLIKQVKSLRGEEVSSLPEAKSE